MANKEELAEDVHFVLEECGRFQQMMTKTDFRKIPPDEFWYQLPRPDGRGFMICGRAGYDRLNKLADIAAARARLSKRIQRDTIRKPLGDLIVQRFIAERRPIDVQQTERILAAAGRAAATKCEAVTHLIPCHLMTTKDPDCIDLGPVVFRNRSATRRLLLAKAREQRDDTSKDRQFARDLLARSIRYFRNFQWLAEVRIDGCDAKTSEILAERAVLSALDCVQVALRAKNTEKMRVGGPAISSDRRAGLKLDKDGKLLASFSNASLAQINYPEGWSAALQNEDISHCLGLCSIALEVAVNPDLDRPLSRRFLDAAQWFGEALRDTSASTRIVKFVTALERLLMTEEHDDITSLVSERLAALCFDPDTPGDRERWRERTRRAYALRSRLVHGSISPHDPDVARAVPEVAELTEAALFRGLSAFGVADGLRETNVGVKFLAKWFQRVIDWADRAEAGDPSIATAD